MQTGVDDGEGRRRRVRDCKSQRVCWPHESLQRTEDARRFHSTTVAPGPVFKHGWVGIDPQWNASEGHVAISHWARARSGREDGLDEQLFWGGSKDRRGHACVWKMIRGAPSGVATTIRVRKYSESLGLPGRVAHIGHRPRPTRKVGEKLGNEMLSCAQGFLLCARTDKTASAAAAPPESLARILLVRPR